MTKMYEGGAEAAERDLTAKKGSTTVFEGIAEKGSIVKTGPETVKGIEKVAGEVVKIDIDEGIDLTEKKNRGERTWRDIM